MTQSKQEQKRMDSNEHILACLSSAPSNAKIIRTAARMANAFGGQFTALFVETPDFSVASKENKERLQENRKLAEQLGANIETAYGEDIPYQIAEFARISGITRIVLGHSAVTHRHRLNAGNEKLYRQRRSRRCIQPCVEMLGQNVQRTKGRCEPPVRSRVQNAHGRDECGNSA